MTHYILRQIYWVLQFVGIFFQQLQFTLLYAKRKVLNTQGFVEFIKQRA